MAFFSPSFLLPSLLLLVSAWPAQPLSVCGLSNFLSVPSLPLTTSLSEFSAAARQAIPANRLVLLGPGSEAADTCHFLFCLSFLCCHPAQMIQCDGGSWGG